MTRPPVPPSSWHWRPCSTTCQEPRTPLLWHLLDTVGYTRSAGHGHVVIEPYSDGSEVDDLCTLLSRLFDDTDPALTAFLDKYLSERGPPELRPRGGSPRCGTSSLICH